MSFLLEELEEEGDDDDDGNGDGDGSFSLFFGIARIEKVLDIECEKKVSLINKKNEDCPATDIRLLSGVDLAEKLAAINSIILSKPDGISKAGFSRLRLIRASLLVSNKTHLNEQQLAHELFRFTEYELRLSSIGMSELRAVFIRLAAPASGILAKLGIFN